MGKGTSVTFIFECKLKNIYEGFLLESILTREEILWRINFILIKFFLNKILLKKIQNECKKPSFHRTATRISWTTGKRKENAVLPFYIHHFLLKEALVKWVEG